MSFQRTRPSEMDVLPLLALHELTTMLKPYTSKIMLRSPSPLHDHPRIPRGSTERRLPRLYRSTPIRLRLSMESPSHTMQNSIQKTTSFNTTTYDQGRRVHLSNPPSYSWQRPVTPSSFWHFFKSTPDLRHIFFWRQRPFPRLEI